MSTSNDVTLVDVETGQKFDVEIDGLDVRFPEQVHGWTDVLDGRIPPYTDQTLDEVREFAVGVRKKFVLVRES